MRLRLELGLCLELERHPTAQLVLASLAPLLLGLLAPPLLILLDCS